MSKKSDYFQFRFESEFRTRIDNMVNEGHANSVSHAIRKFCNIGMEIAKISKNDKNVVNKIDNELKNYNGEFTDSTLKEIMKNMNFFNRSKDLLKQYSDYELSQFTICLMQILINKPWCRFLTDEILKIDNHMLNKENMLRENHQYDKKQRTIIKEDYNYDFGALEELDIEDSIDSSKEVSK